MVAQVRATLAMPSVGRAPTQQSSRAPNGQSGARAAAATPAMVAGATRGAASRLARMPDDRHRALQEHDDRRAHRLCRNGNRDRRPPRPDPPWQSPTDRLTPGAGEEQQTQRGEGGQREAVGPAQPRVDHEQHDDRGGQDRQAGRSPRAAQPDQADGAHRGGSHDARLRSGKDDEAGEGRRLRPRAASDAGSRREKPHPARTPGSIATLLPETADRWVIPVASMASVRSGGVRLVSPMTRAGSKPRASGGRGAAASRRPARRCSATLATAPGRRQRPRLTTGPQHRDDVVARLGLEQGALDRDPLVPVHSLPAGVAR